MASFLDDETTLESAKFRPQHVSEPTPWVGHIPFANWLIRKLSPSLFVELGTHSGNSYFSFCQSIRESKVSCKAFAVDHWFGDKYSGDYGDEVFQDVRNTNEAFYADFSSLIRSSFSSAVAEFRDESIDILHIDGAHSLSAVREDFETWRPKLAPGAVVLFHDTEVRRDDFGVHIFWDTIKETYEHLNFPHSNGLGVIQIPGENTPRVLPKSADEIREMKLFFGALGNLLVDTSDLLLEKERENNLLQSQKNELLKSTSWRITRPVRALAAGFTYLLSPENTARKGKAYSSQPDSEKR